MGGNCCVRVVDDLVVGELEDEPRGALLGDVLWGVELEDEGVEDGEELEEMPEDRLTHVEECPEVV